MNFSEFGRDSKGFFGAVNVVLVKTFEFEVVNLVHLDIQNSTLV